MHRIVDCRLYFSQVLFSSFRLEIIIIIIFCHIILILSPVTVVDGLDGGVARAGAEGGVLRAGQLGRARAGSSQVLSLQPGDPYTAFIQGDTV